jgi:hypothetical protein
MFLRSTLYPLGSYSQDQLFTAVGHPWLFDLSNLNCVHPLDSIDVVRKSFEPGTITETLGQIVSALNPNRGPKVNPTPSNRSICPDLAAQNTYPAPALAPYPWIPNVVTVSCVASPYDTISVIRAN